MGTITTAKVFAAIVAIAITLSWVAMAADIVASRDEQMIRTLDCMNKVRDTADVTPADAYLMCSKEIR